MLTKANLSSTPSSFAKTSTSEMLEKRAEAIYELEWAKLLVHTDRLFAILLIVEWMAAIAFSFLATPKDGQMQELAVMLGALSVVPPVVLALWQPGRFLTRCAVATGQMAFSGLLIHLAGGRLETHFHIFGSLAFLAFYRDWRVFVPATLMVAVDHAIRGTFFPLSVYGVDRANLWRTVEHIGWVGFEVTLLVFACQRSRREMKLNAHAMAELEEINASVERAILERTAQLEESREVAESTVAELSSVMIAANMGLWNYRPSSGVMLSDASYRIFGLSDGLVITLEALHLCVHPEDSMALEEVYKSTVEGRPFSKEFRIIVADKQRWVWVQSQGISTLGGLSLGTVQDISERKQALEERQALEAQLHKVQKMEAVGVLAGGVAHDFNNMLSVIDGFAELCLMVDSPEQRSESVTEIRQAVKRSAGLVRQLLSFARKDKVRTESIDLNAYVDETLQMVRVLLGENIEVEWSPEVSLPTIQADRVQLSQVLTNLAINARDAIDGVGKVTIATRLLQLSPSSPLVRGGLAEGSYVRLTVQDDGSGMSAETAERAFEPFFTTKAPGSGTGLGLASVYGIAQRSGGTATLRSILGRGTTFEVYLPASSAASQRQARQGHGGSATVQGRGTVLVVEDELSLLSLAQRYLKRSGYEVLTASRPSEAIKLAHEFPGTIHLLVTDIMMPEMDGRRLSEELKTLRPGLVSLFMSGYTASVELEQEADFLPKPFALSELGNRVKLALAG